MPLLLAEESLASFHPSSFLAPFPCPAVGKGVSPLAEVQEKFARLFQRETMISQLQIVGYVALAMILSAIIGFEREMADKPAGFRTHMLVGGAATLLVSLSSIIVNSFPINNSFIQVDPIRVLEAIIAGVSFLGAGMIFRRSDQETVEGLTTAASLLFVAGIGVSVAVGQFVLAISVTLLALLVLRGAGWLEKRLHFLFNR
jgi:putative Mg2+ transporter-C (MgtC) family protein